MKIVHHHLIYQAKVERNDFDESAEEILKKFLYDLVKEIKMEVLIEPVLSFSQQKAWTGLVGIVTSHIAFHCWTIEKYLQLDIYSCKQFDKNATIKFLNDFWNVNDYKALLIDREIGQDFQIEQIGY